MSNKTKLSVRDKKLITTLLYVLFICSIGVFAFGWYLIPKIGIYYILILFVASILGISIVIFLLHHQDFSLMEKSDKRINRKDILGNLKDVIRVVLALGGIIAFLHYQILS